MRRFISFIFVLTLTGCSLPIFKRAPFVEEPEGASIEQQISDANFDLHQKFNFVVGEYIESKEAPESIAAAVVAECAANIDEMAGLEAQQMKEDLRFSPDATSRAMAFREESTELWRQKIREDAINAVVRHRLRTER